MDFKEYLISMNYSPNTINEYVMEIERFKEYLRETKQSSTDIILCNLNQHDIYNYLAYLTNNGNKAITRKRTFFAIKCYYKFLCKTTSIVNPCEGIRISVKERRVPPVLTLEECKALINYYTGNKRLLIEILLHTGIRVGELASIKKDDIQEDYIIIHGKGNVLRKVYLNSYLKGKIKDLKIPSKKTIQNYVTEAMKALGLKRNYTYIKTCSRYINV